MSYSYNGTNSNQSIQINQHVIHSYFTSGISPPCAIVVQCDSDRKQTICLQQVLDFLFQPINDAHSYGNDICFNMAEDCNENEYHEAEIVKIQVHAKIYEPCILP